MRICGETPGAVKEPPLNMPGDAGLLPTGNRVKARLPKDRAVSSVGRASRLHREGRRFEPVTAHQAPGSARIGARLTELLAYSIEGFD